MLRLTHVWELVVYSSPEQSAALLLLSDTEPRVLAAIGSGGGYALAAARALHDIDGFDAMQIGTLPQSSLAASSLAEHERPV